MSLRVRLICCVSLLGLALVVAAESLSAGPSGVTDRTARAGGRVGCFVSILPEAFFVERIGGPHVDVRVMVGPGQEPHTFEPTARRLSELSASQVYFAIGIAFEEPLLRRIERNFKRVRVVDVAAGIERRRMTHDHGEVHGGEPPPSAGRPPSGLNESPHGTLDPHVWLSPRLAVKIAQNIRDALVELDPEHSAAYVENCRGLEKELAELDRQIAELLAPYKDRAVFVFHPAYGYFTDAYGLRQVAIEKEGRAPGPRYLAEVIEQAKAQGVKTIFVQAQVSASHADAVARAVGAEVAELDPLARDYMDNLLRMGRKIADALKSAD